MQLRERPFDRMSWWLEVAPVAAAIVATAGLPVAIADGGAPGLLAIATTLLLAARAALVPTRFAVSLPIDTLLVATALIVSGAAVPATEAAAGAGWLLFSRVAPLACVRFLDV